MSEKIECMFCDGTGLYEGFCEEKGYPVVCAKCDGSGAGIGNKPYTGRKKITVKGVRRNPSGSILTAGSKETITYYDFQQRYPEG